MAAPVWVLSVDLQAKTATFTSGMGEAAKAARSSFGDIKDSARDMSSSVGSSTRGMGGHMMEARHGVMMLGEEFGIHLPRGVTTFIASLGPVGAAMEAAFPFLAIILGATLLIEHLVKVSDAADKAAEAGQKLTDGMADGINKADQEIVKSEIEIRKLAGDPAWDLLAQEMQLKDAAKGFENVSHLEGKVKELLETAHASSNWNPFNWFDNSGDVANKVKTLKAEMDGKSQTDQAGVLQTALAIQSKILEQMKGQDSTSATALGNQQKYVDFLKQETELLQKQADAAVLADQGQQGQARADAGKKAGEAAKKEAKAAEELFNQIQSKRIEYEDTVMAMNEKEAKDAEQLFKEIEARNAESVDNRLAQDELESREAEKLFKAIEAHNAESVNNRMAQEEKLLKARQKNEEQGARYAKQFADETIFQNRGMAAAVEQVGKQMLQTLISNTIEGLMIQRSADEVSKMRDASKAARGGFSSVMDNMPWPVNAILAPIVAAGAFASVMAFDEGGIVPGYGGRDTVRAMLTPGEGVMPKPVMDGLKYQAEHGSPSGAKGDIHTHIHYAPKIHAIDGASVAGMLNKHADTFAKAVATHVRKLNQ